MDPEQQPSVWPPAPRGMEPAQNLNPFKSAPIKWVTGLTFLSIVVTILMTLCELGQAAGLAVVAIARVVTVLLPIESIAQIVAYIAFLVWFYRAYKNLTTFETAGLRYPAGWAVGWFFVPIFSLVRPYEMGQVVWKASSPAIDSTDPSAWKSAASGGIVVWWWSLFLFSGAIALLPVMTAHGAKTVDAGFYLEMALAGGFSIAADAVTILLIRAVSARQQEKAAALGLPLAGEVLN